MPTVKLNQVKHLRELSELSLPVRASRRSTSKPIKQYKLTKIERVKANIGDCVDINARDYIQALEHALYVAGFFLEKPSKI
jgi:hypothetical protein